MKTEPTEITEINKTISAMKRPGFTGQTFHTETPGLSSLPYATGSWPDGTREKIDPYYTDRTTRQLSEADGCFTFLFRGLRYAFMLIAIGCFVGGFTNPAQFILSGACLLIFLMLLLQNNCEKVRK